MLDWQEKGVRGAVVGNRSLVPSWEQMCSAMCLVAVACHIIHSLFQASEAEVRGRNTQLCKLH